MKYLSSTFLCGWIFIWVSFITLCIIIYLNYQPPYDWKNLPEHEFHGKIEYYPYNAEHKSGEYYWN